MGRGIIKLCPNDPSGQWECGLSGAMLPSSLISVDGVETRRVRYCIVSKKYKYISYGTCAFTYRSVIGWRDLHMHVGGMLLQIIRGGLAFPMRTVDLWGREYTGLLAEYSEKIPSNSSSFSETTISVNDSLLWPFSGPVSMLLSVAEMVKRRR